MNAFIPFEETDPFFILSGLGLGCGRAPRSGLARFTFTASAVSEGVTPDQAFEDEGLCRVRKAETDSSFRKGWVKVDRTDIAVLGRRVLDFIPAAKAWPWHDDVLHLYGLGRFGGA